MTPFQFQLLKYKNKWAVNIFAEWQKLREVKVPVLGCDGLFKDYDLHKVTADPRYCRNGHSVAEISGKVHLVV